MQGRREERKKIFQDYIQSPNLASRGYIPIVASLS